MALQTSGAISLNDIHVEAGGTSGTTASMNDTDIRGLTAASGRTINSTSSGVTDFSDYYGATSETSLGDSAGSNINGQVQLSNITVSNYISSGGTLRIPSTMWVWSSSTGTPAMTIDIPCTVINEGKIIGCGGAGSTIGWQSETTHGAGGTAINVTSSGVTITNSSGAYIAGGGGGGASSAPTHASGTFQMGAGPGGGGAGGGSGGRGGLRSGSGNSATTISGGSYASGGVLNASGANGSYEKAYTDGQTAYALNGHGGGAGGGAGGQAGQQYFADAGAGGRILPGTGGSGGTAGQAYRSVSGTAGGSAGNAGVNNTSYAYHDSQPGYGGGGGGGWGASGGSSRAGYTSGGAGGAAISGTSRTLSNSGTIYGST